MDLKTLRKKITEIDDGILTLLAKRKDLINEIYKVKKQEKKEVKDIEREKEMKELRAKVSSQLGLDPEKINPIFESILDWSRNIQKDL